MNAESQMVDRRSVVVSVKDNKSGFFHPPTVVDTVESAKRNFKIVLQTKKDFSAFTEFPEDYDLYQVGFWSPWSQLESCPLKLLMSGAEVKAS